MRILGVTASGFNPPSDYELIATDILGTTADSFTFTNLDTYASTYKHLQLRILMRSTTLGVATQSVLTVNGTNTASLYASHTLQGNGSSIFSQGLTGFEGIAFTFRHPGASGTTGAFAAGVVDLLDPYSTTKNKTIRIFQGMAQSENNVNQNSGLFASTNPIASITFTPQGGNGSYVAGSRFSIYGIKG
jgi:hypothetical protein